MSRISVTEQRFRAGSGQRYMSDGTTVRCQAVSKTKLTRLKEAKENPNLTPDDVWPEAQCEHAAVPGKLVCGGRGGHGGGSMSVPAYNMIDFMPADMAAMMREVMGNPQLLSRRFEIAQLVSRILVLYDRLNKEDPLSGEGALATVRRGVGMIRNGDVGEGCALIETALDARQMERETYQDIFAAMNLLKDMTRTEMGSIKELKQIVTYDQLMALVTGIADTLTSALEKYVTDERTRQLISGDVARSVTRRINSGIGSVLNETDRSEAVEGEYSPSE